MRALKTTGRRPLFATAAALAIGAAALLTQPLPAQARDQVAAATAPDQANAHGSATGAPTVVDVVKEGARGLR